MSWLMTSRAPWKRRELVHEPLLGRQVEVVGRLVEDHDLGRLEEDPDEVDAAGVARRTASRCPPGAAPARSPRPSASRAIDALHLVAAVLPELLLEVGEPLRCAPRSGPCAMAARASCELVVEDVEARAPTGRGRSRSASTPSPRARDLGQEAEGARVRTLPRERTCAAGTPSDGRRCSEDLPAPLRPTKPTFSPSPTVNEASRTARDSPISMVSDDPAIIRSRVAHVSSGHDHGGPGRRIPRGGPGVSPVRRPGSDRHRSRLGHRLGPGDGAGRRGRDRRPRRPRRPGAERAAAEIGRGAEPAAVDVTDAGAVASLVDSVVGRHGRIDLLCNNAGIGAGGPVEQLTSGRLGGGDRRRPQQRRLRRRRRVPVDGAAGVGAHRQYGVVGRARAVAAADPLHGGQGRGRRPQCQPASRGGGPRGRYQRGLPRPGRTPILDQTGPGNAVNARKLLTNVLGPPYPAAAMAADILDGVVENRAIIVAPGHRPRRLGGLSPGARGGPRRHGGPGEGQPAAPGGHDDGRVTR